jgi:hypothetical protein
MVDSINQEPNIVDCAHRGRGGEREREREREIFRAVHFINQSG